MTDAKAWPGGPIGLEAWVTLTDGSKIRVTGLAAVRYNRGNEAVKAVVVAWIEDELSQKAAKPMHK